MNQEKQYDISVVIGRFQPPHKAHIEVFKRALDVSNNLIIVIGTANAALTPKDPFTVEARAEMISDALDNEVSKDRYNDVSFVFIEDRKYNLQEWIRDVQGRVKQAIYNIRMPWKDYGPEVVLVGHKKDNSSFYLDMFPQWSRLEIDNIDDLNSTQIRKDMFENAFVSLSMPKPIRRFIIDWMIEPEYVRMCQEYDYIKKYKESWEAAPYDPTFVTTDAVVIQSGHILLIKRRAAPGKGYWALPGGFLEQNETLQQGMIRELREETKLKVPTKVLEGCIKKKEMFDYPTRSLRGRTITQAFLIELPNGQLSEIKAGSDAAAAEWVPLNDVRKENMFEDHSDIIKKMIGDR